MVEYFNLPCRKKSLICCRFICKHKDLIVNELFPTFFWLSNLFSLYLHHNNCYHRTGIFNDYSLNINTNEKKDKAGIMYLET